MKKVKNDPFWYLVFLMVMIFTMIAIFTRAQEYKGDTLYFDHPFEITPIEFQSVNPVIDLQIQQKKENNFVYMIVTSTAITSYILHKSGYVNNLGAGCIFFTGMISSGIIIKL